MTSPVIEAIVSKALDGLHLREIATAHNVANASTPGFVPVRVNFEGELQRLATATADLAPELRAAEVSSLQPSVAAAIDPSERSVKIDQEIAIASETSARYAMLIGMLNRSLQMQQLAIRGS
ncbi:MAG: flagellar basal body rod protein FlgB [Lysobacter sp.]